MLVSFLGQFFEKEIWKGKLGKIQILFKSYCEQTYWFGRPIVQQNWPWGHSGKGMVKNWHGQNPFHLSIYREHTLTIRFCMRLMDLNCMIGPLESSAMVTHAYEIAYLVTKRSGK